MKFKSCLTIFILLLAVFSGCSGYLNDPSLNADRTTQAAQPRLSGTERMTASLSQPAVLSASDLDSLTRSLSELAELERAGSWFQGMALAESSIRETMGDFSGAVVAAYKELSRAYGAGLIQKNELEQSISNLITAIDQDTVIAAAKAIINFQNEKWSEASKTFRSLFNELDEPDGFARWMILVCDLENNGTASSIENRRAAEAYKSIRARYVQFPEYWYRGARVFSGVIAADYAETCVNLSPQGPFADECRSILAAYVGLKTEHSSSIRTMREIDDVINQSVNSGNPEILAELFPLISLPDNPYTVYAVSALRSLTGYSGFRDYFLARAASAAGHLAERLSYISRG